MDDINLVKIIKTLRESVNLLQDSVDVYLKEKEVSPELLSELLNLRNTLPPYSALSEVLELIEEEEQGNE